MNQIQCQFIHLTKRLFHIKSPRHNHQLNELPTCYITAQDGFAAKGVTLH